MNEELNTLRVALRRTAQELLDLHQTLIAETVRPRSEAMNKKLASASSNLGMSRSYLEVTRIEVKEVLDHGTH